jgi:hypothetical protein
MNRTERRRAKKWLKQECSFLRFYCQEPEPIWPPWSLLESLDANLRTLSETKKVSWKTVRRLDKRLTSLLLARSFGNLINRALDLLRNGSRPTVEHARPLIQWLVKIEHPKVIELKKTNRLVAREVREQIQSDENAKREKARVAARIRKQRERLQKNFDKKA